MHHLIALFAMFQTYSKANPIVAGAMSLYGLGIVTYFCRHLPARLWMHIKRQCTTSLTFTNQAMGTNSYNFSSFMDWVGKNKWASMSRNIGLDGAHNDTGYTVGIGNGTHYFSFKNRIFWLTRSQLATSGMQQINYQVTITTFGRNRQIFMDMIEEFRYKPSVDSIGIFKYALDGWNRVSNITERGLHTVIVDKDLKSRILTVLDNYRANRSWYVDRGLPYKKTMIFSGVPGTGKTSLIKGLASHYKLNLCVINLSSLTDGQLENALNTAPTNCIIVMEDFDGVGSTHARKALPTATMPKIELNKNSVNVNSIDAHDANDFAMLTLPGILNALDGIMSLDNKIIIMTTNRLNILDPAMIRKGRVDHIFEIKALTSTEVCEYINLMFPDYTLPNIEFDDILGCDLQSLYFDHQDDVHEFVKAIPHKKTNLYLATSS